MNEEEIYEMILNEDVEKYPLVNEIFAIRDSRQKVNNYTICVNGYISLDAINKAIKLRKENEELKADNYELNNRITDLLENISVQKVKDILNEINKEYIKQEEIFDKHFEKENRDMQDYYIQKEATNIMQELSWIEGKLQELIDRRTKDNER